ncbi:MAG: protein kinase, partial [Planctomycetota bacterium]
DLQHDNLAVAYRFIDFKDEHCGAAAAIVQKRYHGSLDDTIEKLRNSPIAPERALDLLKQVAAGVAYLHKKGFVHRDLKTPNVLVDYGQEYFDVAKLDRFHFVVADFGVIWRAGVEQTFAMSQEGYGTGKLANWKAPETVDAKGRGIPLRPADPKQDIWSFGEIIRKVVEVTDGKPEFLVRLADECQQLDPQLRPSAAELERRLSVHWAVQQDLIDGGMRLLNHPHFVERQHVVNAISSYKDRCRAEKRGGVVILETPPGWGKTAFLTHEANKPGSKVAFYFVRGQRDDPQQMTRHLVQSLSHLAKNAPPTSGSDADQIENLLATAIQLHAFADDEWLVAYVDGIDESRSPREVLNRLPQRPPPQTILILGTRPLPNEGTLLNAFVQHGALRLTQDPASRENREDVADYFRQRLGVAGLMSTQADSLASSVEGSFQLARPLVEEVLAETLTLDALLHNAARLSGLGVIERYYAYYQQSWDRSISPLESEADLLFEQVLDLLRLVCVAQTALSKDQAKRLLGWTTISNVKFDRIIRQ